jgi:hypothetical protein
MPGHIITFSALPVGAMFMFNGTRCTKESSRTAKMNDYNRTFYFRAKDICTIGWPGEVA